MNIEKQFEEVKAVRLSIKHTFEHLKITKHEVYETYMKYINLNKKNDLLDSFYFQSKLIENDFDSTRQLYLYIDNRIYCDYYKLFIIVNKFYKDNFKDELAHKEYPVYKDLDNHKEYEFDIVNDIHQDIIKLIEYIESICKRVMKI